MTTRKDVEEFLKDKKTLVVSYQTIRDFENFLLNGALSEDANRWHNVHFKAEPQTVILVVQTRVQGGPRAGTIL